MHTPSMAPQSLEVHLLSHPMMMSQVALRIADVAALGRPRLLLRGEDGGL